MYQPTSNSLPSNPLKKIALLDVDQCMYDHDMDGNIRINNEIIKALRQNEIHNVYLFTKHALSGTLKEGRLKIAGEKTLLRIELIEILEKLGIKVLEVVDELDPYLNEGVGKAFDRLHLPVEMAVRKAISAQTPKKEEMSKLVEDENKKISALNTLLEALRSVFEMIYCLREKEGEKKVEIKRIFNNLERLKPYASHQVAKLQAYSILKDFYNKLNSPLIREYIGQDLKEGAGIEVNINDIPKLIEESCKNFLQELLKLLPWINEVIAAKNPWTKEEFSNKGLMYYYLLTKLPPEVAEIFFYDDKDDCLKAVRSIHEKVSQNSRKLTATKAVLTSSENSVVEVIGLMIQLDKDLYGRNRPHLIDDAIFSQHLEKKPFIIHVLFNIISTYRNETGFPKSVKEAYNYRLFATQQGAKYIVQIFPQLQEWMQTSFNKKKCSNFQDNIDNIKKNILNEDKCCDAEGVLKDYAEKFRKKQPEVKSASVNNIRFFSSESSACDTMIEVGLKEYFSCEWQGKNGAEFLIKILAAVENAKGNNLASSSNLRKLVEAVDVVLTKKMLEIFLCPFFSREKIEQTPHEEAGILKNRGIMPSCD